MKPGRPTAAYFWADALHRLRRPLVPTIVGALIIFAGTAAIFATTGLAVAGQQATLDRINSPEGRLIAITDPQGTAGLSPESVAIVSSLTGVEWALGVGPAHDLVNADLPGGETVPSRAFYGELPPAIATSIDRMLRPGEAVAAPGLSAVMGLGDGVGAVVGRTSNAVVVGEFVASEPVHSLNNVLLIAAESDARARMLTLWVSVQDVTFLAQVESAVRESLVVTEPGALRIETSHELAALSTDVAAEMGRTAQITVSTLVLTVVVLVAAVQFGRVSGIARDIGRVRALGATRSMIVMQILVNAALCGLIGAATGIAAGLTINIAVAGAVPGAGFVSGIGILMLLGAVVGSLPPAIRASRLDPVRILRVP